MQNRITSTFSPILSRETKINVHACESEPYTVTLSRFDLGGLHCMHVEATMVTDTHTHTHTFTHRTTIITLVHVLRVNIKMDITG